MQEFSEVILLINKKLTWLHNTTATGAFRESWPGISYWNSHERGKRRRLSTDGNQANDKEDKIIRALKTNNKMLHDQLDVHNKNCQLDREQRKESNDALLAALGKLTDAIVKIAEKLWRETLLLASQCSKGIAQSFWLAVYFFQLAILSNTICSNEGGENARQFYSNFSFHLYYLVRHFTCCTGFNAHREYFAWDKLKFLESDEPTRMSTWFGHL